VVVHADTTFLVDTIRESRRGLDGPARTWLAEHAETSVAISVFVLSEMLLGAELHAEPAKERQRIREALGDMPVAIPDLRLATTYARVCADLQRRGVPTGTMDLLIACLALNEEAALLTANAKHFSDIHGLEVLEYR